MSLLLIHKILRVLVIIFVILIFHFIYKINFSERAKKSKENESNVRQVQIGMSKSEMLRIMGQPYGIMKDAIKPDNKEYYYESSFLNDGIYIHIEGDSIVTFIEDH